MTISTLSNTAIVQGNGLTTSFDFSFPVPLLSELYVYYTTTAGTTTLLSQSQYSVTGIGTADGGAVTYPLSGSPIPQGSYLTIQRIVPYQQLTSLVNQSGYYPNVVENALDYLTMQTQQLAQSASLALQIPVAANPANVVLPAAAARALGIVGFDANGNAITYPLPASVGAGNMKAEAGSNGHPGFKAANGDFTPGTTTTLTLSQAYGTVANVFVAFDGTYQERDSYTLNGNQIIFSAPIPTGISNVDVVGGTTLSAYIPAQGSVGDSQLAWGNVLGRVCDSIAALQALNPVVYTRAFVTGYYAASDGGGGPYQYNGSLSQSLANGGTIIAAEGGVGCWVLQYTGTLSVKQFGAYGDGTHDDAPAVQAAVNAMTAGGGLYFPTPAVSYLFKSSVSVGAVSGANSNLTLYGDGDASLIKPGAAVSQLFSVTGKNTCIYGLALVNQSSYATNGIVITTSSSDAGFSARIERNLIVGFTAGISASGQNYDINSNFFQNNTTHVLFTNDGRNTSISDNYMLGGAIGINMQVTAQQAEGLRILNNTILATGGSGGAIILAAGLSIHIAHNILDQTGAGSPGIYANITGGNALADVHISSNWIAGGSGSYPIYIAGNNSDISIVANDVVSSNAANVIEGISATATNGMQIAFNTFRINTVSGNDLSLSGISNQTIIGNTSTLGGSNATANYLSQPTTFGNVITTEGGPTITSGTGAPSSVQPAASIYLRTDGGAGGHLYVSSGGGTWTAVPTV